MNREDLVSVKVSGGGSAAFAAGEKYALKIPAGGAADKWEDGSPITRGEFERVLAPHGPFEIATLAVPTEVTVAPSVRKGE